MNKIDLINYTEEVVKLNGKYILDKITKKQFEDESLRLINEFVERDNKSWFKKLLGV